MTLELFVVEAWADVAIESLFDVVTSAAVISESVRSVSYFAKVLSGQVPEALSVAIDVEVLADVNINVAAVFGFPMLMS